MRRSTTLAFLATLVLPAIAFAQFEACPGGVQVGQQCGGGVCQPICQYDPSPAQAPARNHGPKPPPIVIERWHVADDRFSSFASDSQRGPYGFVSGYESQSEADEAALDQCRARSGNNCEVLAQFKNSCATFAWGGGRYAVMGGDSVEESVRTALERCEKQGGVDCEVIQSLCSEPVYRIVDEKPDDFVEDTSRSQ